MKVSRYLFDIIVLILSLSCSITASDSLKFVSPVDHQVKLSGNFMELRTNHFHAGIDIKSSKGKSGDPIRSVADGYVSRIKVQSGSYGQVLYLDHPNGLTTVYAHLNSFMPEISDWVEALQYELESFEVDVYLPDSLFTVTAGQQIGTMGNTGRSAGPHLHFEIRNTYTEEPLNPESFGFGPIDNIPPVLENLIVYQLNEKDQIISRDTRYFKSKKGIHKLYSDPLKYDSDQIAFGLQCYDQINGSYNKNGINAYQVYLDDSLLIDWKALEYNFTESRKINGFLDYTKLINNGQKVYRLFSPACNGLNSFDHSMEGVVSLVDQEVHRISIHVMDYFENKSKVEFKIQRTGGSVSRQSSLVQCSEMNSLSSGVFRIDFEEEGFFDEMSEFDIKNSQETVMGQKCHKLQLGDGSIAVAKYFKVSCPIPDGNPEKWTFIAQDKKSRWVNFDADTIDGMLSSFIDQLGSIYLYQDTLAPSIEVLSMDPTMSVPWRFRIKDQLKPDGKTDDLNFEARVNSKWVCIQYDIKTDQLIFDDFHKLPDNSFEFVLRVSDAQNNASEFRRSF